LVLLDVTLPDGNGFDLYKNTIKKLQIPTIFLTAKDGEDDIVKGLNIGAEDYITKPFSTKELLARVNKVIARNKNTNIIEIENIKYDVEKMEVYRDNKKIEFTPIEIKILNLFFININRVVTRENLLDNIYEWTGNDVDNHTITVYVQRIRDKLNTDIVKTVKGIGYRIDEK
ncbi:MAG: response regulator transcription factor, partial [Clostridiales bacterium]|nr:response regulator transcription factor [Clostridiales bacterium]